MTDDKRTSPVEIILPSMKLSDSDIKERLAAYSIEMCKANGVDPLHLLAVLKKKYGDCR